MICSCRLQSPAPIVSGAGTVAQGTGRRLLYIKPSADCANRATCGRCLDGPTGKLDLDPNQSYADIIILLHEDDFPCFQRHSEFSQVSCHGLALHPSHPSHGLPAQPTDTGHPPWIPELFTVVIATVSQQHPTATYSDSMVRLSKRMASYFICMQLFSDW